MRAETSLRGMRLDPTVDAGPQKQGAVNERALRATQGASLKSAILGNKLAVAACLYLAGIAIIALLAPVISPETYSGFDHTQAGVHPHFGWRYLLGTDVFGHSVVAYLILGARTTIGIGLLSTAVAVIVGGVIGIAAGVAGGWFDRLVMIVIEVVFTVPFLPLLIVLAAYVGGSDPWSIALLLGLVGVFCAARCFRDGCVSEMRRPSVLAATSAGASKWALLQRHVIPALIAPLVNAVTLLLAAMMAAEATIDFLGFGVRPSTVSWGTALADAPAYITGGFWWWYILPGLALVVTLLSITIVGNAVMIGMTVPSRPLAALPQRPSVVPSRTSTSP